MSATSNSLSALGGAVIVAAGIALSGGEQAPEQTQAGHDSLPVRSTYSIPAGHIALVKVYDGKKLKGVDTLRADTGNVKLYVKSQLIRSK